MKKNKLLMSMLLLIALMSLDGCLQADTETVSETAVLTNSQPTERPTPTLSPSPTPVPTFSREVATSMLLDLLSDNGNCRLPCLWGIMPGEALFQEAETFFSPLSSISDAAYFNVEAGIGNFSIVHDEDEYSLLTQVSYLTYPGSDVISLINFEVRSMRSQGAEIYNDDMFTPPLYLEQIAYYMLPNILAELGRPGEVLIAAAAEIPAGLTWWPFKVIVLYPDEGVFIIYTSSMRLRGGGTILGCPQYSSVEMTLLPRDAGDSYEEYLSPSWQDVLAYGKPLDAVTPISLDQFVEIYQSPTEECIETQSVYRNVSMI